MSNAVPVFPGAAAMQHALAGLVLCMVLLVAYKLLKAAQTQPGLLSPDPAAPANAGRVASITTTIVAAAAYVLHCVAAGAHAGTLPEPPSWVVWTAAGGQLSYLAQKITAFTGRTF